MKTTPLQREILWALAESEELGLLAILERLRQKFPALTPEALLKETWRSLGILHRMGCLYFAGLTRAAWAGFDAARMPPGELYRWDEAGRRWTFEPPEPGAGEIVVLLTQGGVMDLQLIAEQSAEPTPVWKPRPRPDGQPS